MLSIIATVFAVASCSLPAVRLVRRGWQKWPILGGRRGLEHGTLGVHRSRTRPSGLGELDVKARLSP